MRRMLEDKEHLVRMGGLFAIGIATFFVLQQALVPARFGEFGHYRGGALDDIRALPLRYGGHALCETCHTDVVEARQNGGHDRVRCEACHGPLAAHAEAPDEVRPSRPDAGRICLTCHLATAGKPRGFPAVRVPDHAEAGTCGGCHQPHAPKLSAEAAGVQP